MSANPMKKTPMRLNDEEYGEIEEALSATAIGRAFLREHQRRAKVIASDEVRRTVHKLKDNWQEATAGRAEADRMETLRAELRDMAGAIAEARRQISALQPEESSNNRILQAAEELDAIVSATERATGDILNNAERLLELGEPLREAGQDETADTLDQIAGEIFEACGFQDITGQRISKVVNAMRYVEQRVHAMVAIWGVDEDSNAPADTSDGRPDAHLLNGPQLEGAGVKQDEIDRLFGGDGDVAAPSEGDAAPEGETSPSAEPNGALNGQADQSAVDALFEQN